MHGSFAPGYDPPSSDLDNLVSGRKRELSDLVDQSVSERLLRGDPDLGSSSGRQNVLGQIGSLSQDSLSSGLVSLGSVKRRQE